MSERRMPNAPTDLVDFMSDPVEYFDWSFTRLMSMPERDQAGRALRG